MSEREKLYIEAHYYDSCTGELEKAVQVYQQYRQTYPRDWAPPLNLNNIYVYFGDYDQAVTEGRETVRLDPNNATGHTNLASALLGLNRVQEARAVCVVRELSKMRYAVFFCCLTFAHLAR